MIPFRYPHGTKVLVDKKYDRKNKVIRKATEAMELVMRAAVNEIIDHYVKTGHYAEPTLQTMNGVMDSFYWHLIHEAYHSASDESKLRALPKFTDSRRKDSFKRLAGSKWPLGIPKTLTGLEKIFRDRRYWPKIMKRSKIIVDRVRKQYLRKLQKKFRVIQPALHTNQITPLEAKEALMGTWDASKSRVELIFRTETTTYFGKTQTAFFANDPGIIGFLFDSIRDTGRTAWCKSRHGLVYRPGTKELTANTPALHWNCRSHLIPLANTEYNRKLLDDPDRNPANRKVAPLPADWRK